MIGHDAALRLAATSFDFQLSRAERAALDAHLATCAACSADARAMRSDLAVLARLPVAPLDERHDEAVLARALASDRRVAQPLRLLLVATLIALLALGSVVVGAALLEHRSDELAVVVPSPSPAASAVLADPTPVLPSSAPDGSVTLVVREFSCDVCAPGIGTVVLDDGRVIWQSSSGLQVRQLDELGLAQVRAGLAIPAFAKSTDYEPTVRAGASPPAFGPESHRFQLERDGARIDVRSGDAPTYAAWPGIFDIPDESVTLSALAAQMREPETWIPQDRWAAVAQPYEPERYLVVVTRDSGAALSEPRVEASAVDWPFGAIETVGAPYRPGPNTPIETASRCLVVTAATARAMAAAEAAAGAERDLGIYWHELTYAGAQGEGAVVVTTRALLPYQSGDCSDALAW